MNTNITVLPSGKIKFIKILLYTAAAILWGFSHIGYKTGYITWFTCIPFILLIKRENYKSAFFHSWLFGFIVYVINCWWMPYPIAKKMLLGSSVILNWSAGILTALAFYAYHGLLYPAIALTAVFLSRKKISLYYIIFPLIASVYDSFLPKLWQEQVGYTQDVYIYIAQLADITGVPGITFLLFSSNTSIAFLIESLYKTHRTKKRIILSSSMIFLTTLLVGTALIYGYYRYSTITALQNEAEKSRIGIVQGNYSGLDKKNKTLYQDMAETYNTLSENLLPNGPSLIVWPETAIPRLFDINMYNFKKYKYFNNTYLLMGLRLIKTADEIKDSEIYNGLVLINQNSHKTDHYQKIKLLPFAEKMPLPFFNIILNLLGYHDFSAGTDHKIMHVYNIKAAPNICYEALFPALISNSCNVEGVEANVIINATNDSWYGRTIEPMMHLRMTAFRAIENRKCVIRSTCTGYSAIIAPNGTYSYISPLFEQDTVVQAVPLMEYNTVYRQGGYVFKWSLVIVSMILLIWALIHILIQKIVLNRL